jgi:hypothetical protein
MVVLQLKKSSTNVISIYRIDPFCVAYAQNKPKKKMKSTSVSVEVSRNAKMCGYILHEVSKNKRSDPVGIGISTYTNGDTNRAHLSAGLRRQKTRSILPRFHFHVLWYLYDRRVSKEQEMVLIQRNGYLV